jgi:hypothetical protein
MRIGPFEPGDYSGDCDAPVLVVLGGESVMRRDAHRRQKERGRRNADRLAHFQDFPLTIIIMKPKLMV